MYLEQRAEEDTLFAKKYRNPAKNIDECVWKIQCKLPPKTKRFCPLVLK